jgi:hypothetical protein
MYWFFRLIKLTHLWLGWVWTGLGETFINARAYNLISDLIMVECLLTATEQRCPGSGAMTGVYIYPTEMNVRDGDSITLQIITNMYVCDDTGYVPTEYCIDWEDGTHTHGTFSGVYSVPANVPVNHTYRFPPDWDYDSKSYNPSVTISTACGGLRTVNTDDAGRACRVYVWKAGTPDYIALPVPNMGTVKWQESVPSCGGIYPEEPPADGGTGGDDGGYVPPGDAGGSGYVPPSDNGSDTGGDTGRGTDIIGTVTNFYENNKMLTIGAIVVVGAFLLFRGKKS